MSSAPAPAGSPASAPPFRHRCPGPGPAAPGGVESAGPGDGRGRRTPAAGAPGRITIGKLRLRLPRGCRRRRVPGVAPSLPIVKLASFDTSRGNIPRRNAANPESRTPRHDKLASFVSLTLISGRRILGLASFGISAFIFRSLNAFGIWSFGFRLSRPRRAELGSFDLFRLAA